MWTMAKLQLSHSLLVPAFSSKCAVGLSDSFIFDFFKLLLTDFCYLVNPAVNNGSKACFVGGVVFCPTAVLLYHISFQYIFKPEAITLQGNGSFEKSISVYGFGKPILFGSVHLFAFVEFFP